MTGPVAIEVWVESHGRNSESLDRAVAAAAYDGATIRILPAPGESFDPVPADNVIVIYVRNGYLRADAVANIVDAFVRFPRLALVFGDSEAPGSIPIQRPPLSGVWLRSSDYLGPVVAVRSSYFDLAALVAYSPPARALRLAFAALNGRLTTAALPVPLGVEEAAAPLTAGELDAVAATITASIEVPTRVETVTPELWNVRVEYDAQPSATVILRATGAAGLVATQQRIFAVECLRSMLESTTYPDVEYLVVPTSDVPRAQLDALESLVAERGLVLPPSATADINSAIAVARGSHIAVVGERMELVTPDWLEAMIGICGQPGVGAVGGMVFAETGAIIHAGFLHECGVIESVGDGLSWGQQDALHLLHIDREVSAVSGECLLARRDLLDSVGGYTPRLPLDLAGFDLSMKMRSRGLVTVFTPASRWYGFTGGTKPHADELEFLHARWSSRMQMERRSRPLTTFRY